MAEKVKVSREVAEFIESCKNSGPVYWEDQLLHEHIKSIESEFEGVKEESKCLDKFSPIELAKILINGYEIEETPEEKVIYNLEAAVDGMKYTNAEYGAYTDGVLMVLEAYDIKIKGINK